MKIAVSFGIVVLLGTMEPQVGAAPIASWNLFSGVGETSGWRTGNVTVLYPTSASAQSFTVPLVKQVKGGASTIGSLSVAYSAPVTSTLNLVGEAEVNWASVIFKAFGVPVPSGDATETGDASQVPSKLTAVGFPFLLNATGHEVGYIANIGLGFPMTSRFRGTALVGGGRNTSTLAHSAALWQLKLRVSYFLNDHFDIFVDARWQKVTSYVINAQSLKTPFRYDVGSAQLTAALAGFMYRF